MAPKINATSCDVLIIGAGGAGLRAAIEAHEVGAKVIVLSKSLLGKAHTVMAEGGIAASVANVDSKDNWKVHFSDTVIEGGYIGDWRMIEKLAKEAPDRVYELEHYGALFDRTADGKIMQRAFGAHTYRRLCHVGDKTGLELIRTLQDQILHRDIKILDELYVTKLIVKENSIKGAIGFSMRTGEFFSFACKAVIVATGGAGMVYRVTSNSWESTGDGMALAYEAGAALKDMEMVQFHPTGLVWPSGVRGLLVTEGVRGEGGILVNAEGERFMARYDAERMELSSRDVVARAIYREVQAGRGTPHGGAWLDITSRGAAFINRKLPNMRAQFQELADVDITRQPMEVAPTCHYMMGGIRVDPDTCATPVPGLFAAGEVAAGLHGANRLGGNSLADLLVFGRRAGESAARFSKEAARRPAITGSEVAAEIDRVLEPLERARGVNPYALLGDLQRVMSEHVGIVRTRLGLQQALDRIWALRERAAQLGTAGGTLYNPGWNLCLDLDALLLLGEAVARSALTRTESRGAHYRADFPEEDPAWGQVNIVVARDGKGTLQLRMVPVSRLEPEQAP